MRSSFSRQSDEQLVESFRVIAQQLGESVVNWLPAVRDSRRLISVGDALRARGRGARLKLAPLLDNENRFVRYYAAKELIGIFPQRCRAIIEENTRERDAIAGDAGMSLWAMDQGIYKPD
jgi:hypothetical protein